MTSIIVLNQDNIVDAQNNTLVYKFPNSVQFPHHQIAVQSVSMYYSWQNINSIPLENNTLQLTWIVGTTQTTNTITIPNGLYEIADINYYFQWWSIQNGFYLIDATGNNVYYFEMLVNPTTYSIQINTFPVPTSLPANYTAPSNWIGYPTTTYNPSLTFLANFNQIIGFSANFTTPLTNTGSFIGTFNQYGTYTVLSTTTPNVQPNSNMLFSVSNINNKYASPSSIIYSLSPNVAIGSQIIEKPPQFSWNKLLPGTYNELRLQLLGNDYKPLNILDNNMTILLAIKNIQDEEVLSLLQGSK
jgi:hypothetical protein